MRQEESPSAKVERLEREIDSLKSKTDEENASQWRNKRKKLAKALYELFRALKRSHPLVAVQCLARSALMTYPPAYNRLFGPVPQAIDFAEEGLIELDKNQLYLKALQALAGVGCKVNHALAFRCFELAVKKGNSSALAYLGWMYFYGKGIGKDVCSALNCYRKAAELGDPFAQNILGYVYLKGIAVAKDSALARYWYQKSAEGGFAAAQKNLGDLWKEGYEGERDYAIAFDLFRKAAEQGVPSAQIALAEMYCNAGFRHLALDWWRKAARRGSLDAYLALARAYEFGAGVPQDFALEKSWYKLAAKRGSAFAMRKLGVIYQNARGVLQNYGLAFRWYSKAEKHGSIPAANDLGWCYHNGWGVEQNFDLALFWYRKAATMGEALAQSNVAWMYLKGRGVPQDNTLALHWYRKAAAQGDGVSIKALKKMYADNLIPWNANDVVQYRDDAQKYSASADIVLAIGREAGDFSSDYHLAMMQNDQERLFKLREEQPNGFFKQITIDPFLDEKNRFFWIKQLFDDHHRLKSQRPKLDSDNLATVNMEVAADQYAQLSKLGKPHNKAVFINPKFTVIPADFSKVKNLKEKVDFLIDILKTIPENHVRYAEAEFMLSHLHYMLDQNSPLWESHLNACAKGDLEKKWVDDFDDIPHQEAFYFAFNLLLDFKVAGSDAEKKQALNQKANQMVTVNKYSLMPMLCLVIMAETHETRLNYLNSIKLTHDPDLSKTRNYLSDLFQSKWSAIEKSSFEKISNDIALLFPQAK